MMFELPFYACRTSDARGVDDDQFLITGLDPHVNRIAGGSRRGVHDRALRPSQPVEQRGLAGIGAANQSDTKGGSRGRLGGLRSQQIRYRVEQFFHSKSMRGGDREQALDAEAMELAGLSFEAGGIQLVDRQQGRTPRLTNQGQRFGVGRTDTGPAVHHKNHHVGGRDRLERLRRDPLAQALALAEFQAAAVDQDKAASAMLRRMQVQVARGARDGADDGAATAGDAIKQRRFARVSTAHQDHHGQPIANGRKIRPSFEILIWKSQLD